MHLSRDTHQSLNESIKSINLGENYQLLTEEEYSEIYDDFIEFVAENYTEEQVINSSAEELLEGFWDNIKSAWTQFKRGAAGELTWSGAEKYPAKKEEKPSGDDDKKEEPSSSKPKPTTKPETDEDIRARIKPKLKALRRDDAKKHFPDDKIQQNAFMKGIVDSEGNVTQKGKEWNARMLQKSREEIRAELKRKSSTPTSPEKTLKQKMQEKGLVDEHGKKTAAGSTAATAVRDKADKVASATEKAKKTILNNRRGLAYKKCTDRGGKEKDCEKYASSIMASKEYYSDLRQRLIENYKK